ncbi:hypothetical protein SAMN04487861_102138 [Selenomonas ruminantium]|uniref:Uncharacterized protein n=1 Tax=Selenomonas ruminantium TaxID=971 RepID=A0A1I3C3Q3_SELRU|nr:hypothetical protein SAMN04487861_102138 [Selenomonas ruminantium]
MFKVIKNFFKTLTMPTTIPPKNCPLWVCFK